MANTRTIKRATPPSATGNEWVDPTANPEEANAKIAAVLAETSAAAMPEVSFPPSDTVTLPGGLVRKDGVIKDVQVRELTGEDEEALARASQSMNPFTFLDRLLRCGVVRLGNEPVSETEKLVPQLLIGDREALILGIREATYGNKLDVPEWQCATCGVKVDLSMDLADIPVVKLTDPANETIFKVDMRKGGYALVRLATGSDQLAMFENPDLSGAQRDTILLSRCVTSITDASGVEHSMAGFPSMAREMAIPDRHAILNQLRDKQPGPKYDKVSYTCESCNEPGFVVVTIGNLFLDLGWV